MARSSDELDAVRLECLNLLIVHHCYRATINAFDPNRSRADMHRWIVSLMVFENDLVMRICRLDDDDRNQHHLRSALLSVRNQIPQKEAKAIDDRLRSYRRSINSLKQKVRNYYLAHLSTSAEVPSAPRGVAVEPIEEVVKIIDAIAGEPIAYTLKVGSLESPVNLRRELSPAL